jgi:ABC-type sulfate transport system permease subunit
MEAHAEIRRTVSWAAILLPVLAVAGAAGCFAAGLQANGTGHEPVLSYVLPLVISPVVAALIAVLAAVVRRGRLYVLGFGYAVVVVSLVLGLVAAHSGGNSV